MRTRVVLAWVLIGCGGEPAASGSDASPTEPDAPDPDGPPADVATDDFERGSLGSDWTIAFPPPPNDQVRIIGDSDLGMAPGPQGFFIAVYTGRTFSADQFCEATIPIDADPDWIHQVFVRRRGVDAARYGFGYNGDPGQPSFGTWYFKYDGVPSAQTRVFATAPAPSTPAPGDRIRVEIEGFALRGYWNDMLVLEATDTDASRIDDGAPGLAARWATGNAGTPAAVKVWEGWAGGSL